MVSVVALLIIICAVYFIVLAGTVAYQLTGLDWDTAQFQALSAFTMTGFTTRASELVIRHPVRRRITMALIVTGYAATASVVATLVGSVALHTAIETAANVVVLLGCVAGLVFVVRRQGLHQRLAAPIRNYLARKYTPDQVPHEELLQYQAGYAITRIEVPEGSRLAGKRLRDSELKLHRLQVLAIERGTEVEPVPDPDWIIAEGDHVVLYGKMDNVQAAFASRTAGDT